jgi:tetratricopeptide (TPR) repeat protein
MTRPQNPSETRKALTPAEALNTALSLLREGQLRQAAQLYRALLDLDGKHVAALYYLGVIATREGRVDEAVGFLRQSIALDASRPEPHNDLGIALATLGRFEEAIVAYGAALAIRPNYVEAHNNAGTALIALNRATEATGHFERALEIRPQSAELLNNLGNALMASLRHGAAEARFRAALAISPDFAQAHNNLGLALAALNRPEEAIKAYQRAISLNPGYSNAHSNLASALASLNRHEPAIVHFETALADNPNVAETHNNLGNSLVALNRLTEALTHYHEALRIRPNYAEARNNLGSALAALDRHAEAIPHYHKAIDFKPDFADAHNNLGNAFAALDRPDEAISSYRRALDFKPTLAEAHAGLGNIYRTLGRLDEARQNLDNAVVLAPKRAEFHHNLSETKRFAFGDPQLTAMEALAQDIGVLSEDERVHLNFALAKAYRDLGEYERSFRHLLEGNAGKRARINYDEAATLELFGRTATVFTPELMRRNAGYGNPSSVPIFIIGMPRSGTTLIEQILASHLNVFGAGEISDFKTAVVSLAGSSNLATPFPEIAAVMTAEQFRRLGTGYIDRVRGKAPGIKRVTDKALGNVMLAGLINMALPNATIIHARRNPVDTCLSCFTKLFAGEMPFKYDLAELGRYYRAYDALMAHWRVVLPDGVMLEMRYEDLVADFEAQARRLVAHCGLDWDERCLSFHETERPVKTASATQVRQPIYRSSVGNSQPFVKMLQPLLDVLGL